MRRRPSTFTAHRTSHKRRTGQHDMRLGRPAARRRARAACRERPGGRPGWRHRGRPLSSGRARRRRSPAGRCRVGARRRWKTAYTFPRRRFAAWRAMPPPSPCATTWMAPFWTSAARPGTIPPAIRRALTNRDQRCRFPGCDCHHCDAHHVRHWADGGTTKLENLVLLCRRHHRAVHEEGFRVELRDDGAPHFFWPDGRPLPEAPSLPHWCGPPLQPTTAHLESGGIAINADTATPDWHGERLDLDWAILVLHPPAPSVRAVNDVPTETPPALPPGPVLDTAPS